MKSKKMQLKQIDNDEGIVEFVASSETMDSHGDIVKQQGWEFADNIPLLYEHKDETFPIGKVINHRVVNDELIARAQVDLDDEMGEKVWEKMKRGFLNQFSVGFQPLESKPLENGRAKFTKQLLREISVVSVGSNADTGILNLKSILASKESRVLSSDNRRKIQETKDVLESLLQQTKSKSFESDQELFDETMKYFAGNSDLNKETLKEAFNDSEINSPFDSDKELDNWKQETKEMIIKEEKNVSDKLEDMISVEMMKETYPQLADMDMESLVEMRDEMIEAMSQAAMGVIEDAVEGLEEDSGHDMENDEKKEADLEEKVKITFPEDSEWEDYDWS